MNASASTYIYKWKPVSIKSLNKRSLPAINPEAASFIAFQPKNQIVFFSFVHFLLFACYLINKISWVKHVYECVCAHILLIFILFGRFVVHTIVSIHISLFFFGVLHALQSTYLLSIRLIFWNCLVTILYRFFWRITHF